jgi:hypothetical protein
VRWHHEAVIDFMIARPECTQGQIAKQFGFSETWVSLMVNSDAFKARYAERKSELVDPMLIESLETRFKAVAQVSLDKMLEKLTGPLGVSDDFLLKSAALAKDALGYGARAIPGQGGPQVAVVINVPAKVSQDEWAARYSSRGASQVVEVSHPDAPPAEAK